MSKIIYYDMNKVMMLKLHSMNFIQIEFLQKSKNDFLNKHLIFHVFYLEESL